MKQAKLQAAVAVGMALLLGACGGNGHRSEIAELEQARQEMVRAAEAYEALPQDSIDAVRVWASAQLQDFELLAGDSGIVLNRAEGAIINEVGKVRRLLKDNPKRIAQLRSSQEQVTGQIQLLIEALESRATVDGAGTPIDSTYIRVQVSAERTSAERIAASWEETTSYATKALSLAARTKPAADSLGTELRKRLAVWVLENSAP